MNNVTDNLTGRQIGVLVVMALGFGLLIYGLSKKGWYFEEMSGLFHIHGCNLWINQRIWTK